MKLTSCETCGMRWTAKPREQCPRCALAHAVEMRDGYSQKNIEAREACRFTLRILNKLQTEEFARGGDKPARDLLHMVLGLGKDETP